MRLDLFQPAEHFRPLGNTPVRLLPFRFMRWQNGMVLLTNDGGEFEFLQKNDFDAFVTRTLPTDSDAFARLQAKHFVALGDSTVPIELLATKLRSKKAFLDGFTKLHLFVVTLRCDHSCPYCQVSRVTADRTRFDMSRATAARAVDLMFRSPSPDLKVEFQGGESFLNTDLIRFIIDTVHERNVHEQRRVEFVAATNLSELTDETLSLCKEHDVCISTSLDGPAWLHNANRPRPGHDSYERTVKNIGRARQTLGHDRVSALMTTTVDSLEHPTQIVDEYISQGFDHIFLRPISPYGFAVRTKAAFRYHTEAFLRFYRTALDHIIEANRHGTPFVEVYAQIILQKMLTPFATGYVDLQSPAGLGIAAVVYNYDGDVYASDEGRMLAEMGDYSFRLGNVHQDTYEDIFGGVTLRALIEHSCVEALPGCTECAFAPYCGSDPVFNWATQGDPIGHRPTSAFCGRNMAIIRLLFDRITTGDDFTKRLLLSWATGISPTARAAR